jgi:hypothetical protein
MLTCDSRGIPSRTLAFAGLAALVVLAGCAGSGEIQYATGRRAGVSPDGLHLINTWGGRAQRVYVKPGVDLQGYDKVMLEPVVVRFGLTSARELSRETIAVVKQNFRDIFEREIGKSTIYTLVKEPGPDVLRLTPQLIDLVITAPKRPATPDESIVIRSAGAVTLALELSDSRSHAALVRAYDRRAISNPSGLAYKERPGAGLANARMIFVGWAQRLRGWLDSVRTIPPLPVEEAAGAS